jgi:hypothetical protein
MRAGSKAIKAIARDLQLSRQVVRKGSALLRELSLIIEQF